MDAPPNLPAVVTVVRLAPDPFTTKVADQRIWPSSSESSDEAITVVWNVWRVDLRGSGSVWRAKTRCAAVDQVFSG